jgi:hydroxyacylglutathione hydrolase
MKIERFEIPGLAQYSYIISSGGKAAVIDPIRDVDRYTAYTSAHKLTITHVLETHIHADFAAGSVTLAKGTGAELALSGHDKGEHYRYTMAHRALHDGQSIQIGAVRLQALHTPGHTPEHLSFVLYDNQRSASEPVALFSGDFLFVGSLGRPDLLGDDAKQGLAHELYLSLHERIASLPDYIEIHPGHGAGSLCGAGMSERAESTLGYERATNPLFKVTEDEFVREILIDVPPMPSYYPRMKELNAKGAPSLTCLPGQPLSVEAVKSLAAQEDVTLLDLRRPESFGGAHMMGAINIGAGQNLALWAGWLLSSTQRIVLIGDEGKDESSRRALTRVGLDHIEGFLSEGMPAWIEAGEEFTRTPQLSIAEVKNRMAKTVVVDVRSDKEWAAGHIEGAQHIMLGDLQKHMDGLPRDRFLITVCGSGYRSSIAASLLKKAGFAGISSMDGGMTAWNRQKLPMTMD